MPSESHACAWQIFEKEVLAIRSLLYTFSRLLYTLFAISIGKESYDVTKEYLDEGSPANADLARAVLPYAKVAI